MKLLATTLFLASLASPAFAWDIDKMNAQIEKTNVIVNSVCSGTIVSKEQRLILTAFHCVNDLFTKVTKEEVDPKTGEIKSVDKQVLTPLKISVNKIRNFEVIGTENWTAKIVKSDEEHDIALVQVIDYDWIPEAAAPFASDDYSYKRGLRVYAVGNPAITFDNSITEGIISAPQRMLDIDEKRLKVFQVSASVIGGNSGGSIVNDNGELIGTTSATMRSGTITFAVPISFSKEMVTKAGFGAILPPPTVPRDRTDGFTMAAPLIVAEATPSSMPGHQ